MQRNKNNFNNFNRGLSVFKKAFNQIKQLNKLES